MWRLTSTIVLSSQNKIETCVHTYSRKEVISSLHSSFKSYIMIIAKIYKRWGDMTLKQQKKHTESHWQVPGNNGMGYYVLQWKIICLGDSGQHSWHATAEEWVWLWCFSCMILDFKSRHLPLDNLTHDHIEKYRKIMARDIMYYNGK